MPVLSIRRLRGFTSVPVLCLTLVLAACNGGSTGEGGGGGEGLRATIDGKAWEAAPIGTVAMFTAAVPGTLTILGSDNSGGNTRSITLTLWNVRGTGKYALGVGSVAIGGTGQVSEATGAGGNANSWITPGTGSDGEVDITVLTGGRVKGTFFFTADTGHRNAAGGKRTVTGGRFDLAVTGTPGDIPAHKGSKLTARLGSHAYNAANLNARLTDEAGQPGVTIATTTSLHTLNFILAGATAPGTYALSNSNPTRVMTAGRRGGTAEFCCWGGMVADTGSVVIESISSTRIKGTFRARLVPQQGAAATAALEVAEGAFDVGVGF